jgi:hypothetical protein
MDFFDAERNRRTVTRVASRAVAVMYIPTVTAA